MLICDNEIIFSHLKGDKVIDVLGKESQICRHVKTGESLALSLTLYRCIPRPSLNIDAGVEFIPFIISTASTSFRGWMRRR